MDGSTDPASTSDEPTTACAEQSSSVGDDSSCRGSTALNQEILELLRAIHDNGKRQIEILEAITSGDKVLDQKKETKKRIKATEKEKELARNLQPRTTNDESYPTWNPPFLNPAVDLFASTDEDDKLSKIIILGIMGAGSSLLETFDIADQSWDFLWRGRYETHVSVLVTYKKRWDHADVSRPDKLRIYLEDLRSMREQLETKERDLLPYFSLRRNGCSIRLKFTEPYSDTDQLDPGVAGYLVRNWHEGPVARFWPYGRIIGGNTNDFDYARRLGPVPIRIDGHNIFQFQQMGLVMEFMGIQVPGGPNLRNLKEAWEFILGFVGSWKIIQRMKELSRGRVTSYPQWISPNEPDQVIRLALCHLKYMMRVFSPLQAGVDGRNDGNRPNAKANSAGLQMSRITGGLERTGTAKASLKRPRLLELTEKRIGLMMTTTVDRDPPVFKLFCLADWEVHGRDIYKNMSPEEIMVRRWYRGIALFQEALLDCFEFWNKEWEKTMDAIEAMLKVQLEDIFDPSTRLNLMFESTSNSRFEQSETYFFVIELLRIATDWVTEATVDLDALRVRVCGGVKWKHKDASELIETRWEEVLGVADKYKDSLLKRIEKKREEVYSLREALFNATSVREATKGTHINEYILVFTVMTVLYLPLGFMATLYGIDMFDFKMPGQKTQFAITTTVVSVATYVAASGLLYGVRRRRKKGSYREVLGELIRDTAVSLGQVAQLSLVKKAFGVQNGPTMEEYDAQEGIPEHLKIIFFTNPEQDA
ncbi:hypothetical protein PGQ11_005570 [Apiospora arundinis]|uniref:Uncharacterized protein n=1 Tax=Apiospora arundinis TaxID=335852 RepID=A0ABR2JB94_9PEZI